MNQDAIVSYFQELADASPIPLVLYNFPGVVAGLDINSEMLDILGQHKNIVAVKLTCGGIAKVARISAAFKKSDFVALAGQSDWLIPALSVGGVGTITGVDERRGAVVGSGDSDALAGLTIDRGNFLIVEERRGAGVIAVAVVALEREEVDDATLAAAGGDDVRYSLNCMVT